MGAVLDDDTFELVDDSADDFWPEDEEDHENACWECGAAGDGNCCGCGMPLCHMHFEIQCGYCSRCCP